MEASDNGDLVRMVVAVPRSFLRSLLGDSQARGGVSSFAWESPARDLPGALLLRAEGEIRDGRHGEGLPGAYVLEAPLSIMSVRELDTLKLLAQGMTNQQISHILCVSPNTAKTHIRNIRRKLHTANRVETALLGRELLQEDSPEVLAGRPLGK